MWLLILFPDAENPVVNQAEITARLNLEWNTSNKQVNSKLRNFESWEEIEYTGRKNLVRVAWVLF